MTQKKASPVKRWTILAVLAAAFVALISTMAPWEAGLHFLFPGQAQVLYPGGTLLSLVNQHVQMVAISSGLTILVAVPLGIWVTRPGGRSFRPLVTSVTSIGQTFPPVAVLALAVPALGFGVLPTVTALFLYGLLPVVRNTIAGLEAVAPDALDAAYGMGMSHRQALLKVELPLAAPIILAGIRISVIINIGTAAIGAAIGAGGLGSPIVAGLVQFNVPYVLEGAIPVALLALLADGLVGNAEATLEHGKAAA